MAEVERLSLVIEIGGMPVRVNTTSQDFLGTLQDRYAGFVVSRNPVPDSVLELELDRKSVV